MRTPPRSLHPHPARKQRGFLSALCLLSLPLLPLLSGCAVTLNPPDHRAKQYSGEFENYTDETRQRLREATVAVGDDRMAVYIALGTPHNRSLGYERNKESGKVVQIEIWEYAGYPAGEIEGRFVTLNNGGFASPIRFSAYGKVKITFADNALRSYSHDPAKDPQGQPDRTMALPSQPR